MVQAWIISTIPPQIYLLGLRPRSFHLWPLQHQWRCPEGMFHKDQTMDFCSIFLIDTCTTIRALASRAEKTTGCTCDCCEATACNSKSFQNCKNKSSMTTTGRMHTNRNNWNWWNTLMCKNKLYWSCVCQPFLLHKHLPCPQEVSANLYCLSTLLKDPFRTISLASLLLCKWGCRLQMLLLPS